MPESTFWAVVERRHHDPSWECAVPLGNDLPESLTLLRDTLDKYPAYTHDVRHYQMPQPSTAAEVQAAWHRPLLASRWASVRDLDRNRVIKDMPVTPALTVENIEEQYARPQYSVSVVSCSPPETAKEATAGWESGEFFSEQVWEAREARLAAEQPHEQPEMNEQVFPSRANESNFLAQQEDFPLGRLFTDALALAHAWHMGHYRKGTQVPYISHLLGVASVALEFGANEAQAVAALLHDVLEDGPANTGRDAAELRAEIVERFGEAVALLVDSCTDATPKANEKKKPWAERKTEYLLALPKKTTSELLVSASDKLHNARAILTDVMTAGDADNVEAFFKRFNQGKAGTLQYYRLLVDAYRAAPSAATEPRLQALFDELDHTVTAIQDACGVTSAEVRGYDLLRL